MSSMNKNGLRADHVTPAKDPQVFSPAEDGAHDGGFGSPSFPGLGAVGRTAPNPFGKPYPKSAA